MKKFFAQHTVSIVISLAVVVSVAGAIWYVSSNKAPSFGTTAATSGNVVESLDEPATVLADDNSPLSFQEGGQIAAVNVSEGQEVSAGTAIATLSSGSLQAAVAQATAALEAAQANLAQAASGTRPEQLTIDQEAVTSAQSSLSVDVGNAYASADDAVQNQTDNLFTNPTSNNPTFLVPITDSQQLNNIVNGRITVQATLNTWYAALNSSSSNLISLAALANTSLGNVQSYLDLLALAVNDATSGSSMSATTLAGYKANISVARTEVDTAITTMTNAESALQAAQNTLALAQAGSTPQAIEALQASVAQAQAAQTAAQVALNNASLVAPFSGTVENLTAQIGQVVSPGAPIASLVNNGGLKIQVYVSEENVAQVHTGDTAQISLDAFPASTTFPATVTTIDDTQTLVNGTPAYLVTLHFAQPEPQLKDGMTGNAHLILAEHDNVIEVPSRLVINNGNGYSVTVVTATGTMQVPVTIGLVGDNGMTEITSGINQGDELANF
jgi:HlyD family secretion protein